jgi:predicted 3-demethylubiquinone-9 3-methyltransferase (glyoxalase superfamily)
MAFDAKPSTWLGAGYSVASNAITMNTNDAAENKTLTELTDAEAHATTGDIRKVIFALQEKLFAAYNATATADRPTKMTIQKSTSVNTATGVVTNVYTTVIYTGVLTQEVAAES